MEKAKVVRSTEQTTSPYRVLRSMCVGNSLTRIGVKEFGVKEKPKTKEIGFLPALVVVIFLLRSMCPNRPV